MITSYDELKSDNCIKFKLFQAKKGSKYDLVICEQLMRALIQYDIQDGCQRRTVLLFCFDT